MSYWVSTKVSFGITKQHSSKIVYFTATEDVPEIIGIIPGCGCTVPQYDEVSRTLKVKYTAGSIPDNHKGNESISRKVTINYIDGSKEELFVTGVKIR